MKHSGTKFLCLTASILMVLSFCAHAAGAKKSDTVPDSHARMSANRALGYSFASETHTWSDKNLVPKGRIPLGTVSATASNVSPGVTVGYTWYDYQQNCSMGRMIGTGPHSGNTGPTIVHMGWMHLPDSVFEGRTYMYNAYKSSDHTFAGAYRLHDYDDQYSGYVNVDVTPDNRALVGGHCDEKGPVPYQAHIHFDACSACELFDTYVRVPDSLGGYEQLDNGESLWPKFFLQFGTDTVLHVVTRNSGYQGSLMYFRMVGYEGSGEWDFPPYCFDTVQCYSHIIGGERVGDRVALSWLASPPYQEPECDTCSGLTPYDTYLIGQMDNDLYVQVSDDQGATWHPKNNVTKVGIGEASWKPYPDISVLFDQDGYLHVVFSSVWWAADTCIDDGGWCFTDDWWLDASRIFHWSENIPYIRPVCDHNYIPSDSCGPGKWAVTVAKMSVSECDGKLYCMWSQFNDIPNGVIDDCALYAYEDGLWEGSANGDIWFSVSGDAGMTWDVQRNLTNSYTPRCDPYGAEDCQSDYWASMTRWGRQVQTGEDWSMAEVVDPSGGASPTDYYLDIQYVNDHDAGGAIWDESEGREGTWTNNPIKWFRIPCVEPIPNPIFIAEWTELGDPNYVKPGESLDTTLSFENTGNVELTYSLTVVEDNGPSGWLGVSGFSGTVPSGLASFETGNVHLNQGGIITATGNYYGRLHVEGNDPNNLPADIEIELIVADTIISTTWDAVNTTCLALAVATSGNMGHDGRGQENMDYYPEDCDETATVYLYDGSPLLGRIMGDDTVFNWSIWGAYYLNDYGFRPQGGEIAAKYCASINAEIYESGTFTTQDSTIAFEKIWVAPSSDCPFIIEYMRMWSFDGAGHDDLMVGEATDWDIPWDYLPEEIDPNQVRGAVNTGGIDVTRNLIYCQGYETYTDTGYPYNCQYNNERFGGNAFIESYLNGSLRAPMPYAGYVGENDSTQDNIGFIHGKLWTEMAQSGFKGTDSTEDLHTVFTFENALDLGATDVYEVTTILATVHQGTLADLQAAIDAGNAWYTANGGMSMFADEDGNGQIDICIGCCVLMGDFNDDEQVDALDIVDFVDWLWKGGPPPPCPEQADLNCDCQVDALDLVYAVEWFWKWGPEPCPCHECEEM